MNESAQHPFVADSGPGCTIMTRDSAGQLVATAERAGSLYEAAGILYAKPAPTASSPVYVVLDRNTGETWSYLELFNGGFMDDHLSAADWKKRCGSA